MNRLHFRLPNPQHGSHPWLTTSCLALLLACAPVAQADIDGHGPDAWRVTGIAVRDVLNARMGPGTNYPVIETFAHDERGMQQITCVPYYTPAHYERMSQAQIDALPPRWCLMRDRSMAKAGWVAQRYITPDGATPVPQDAPAAATDAASGDALIEQARSMVADLYDAEARGQSLVDGAAANRYFTADIAALLRSGQMGAHPLYGAQDFEGRIVRIAPDPDQPMFRGMITIRVDFTNFGQPQTARFMLRADSDRPAAPLRIFRVEHDGWEYP